MSDQETLEQLNRDYISSVQNSDTKRFETEAAIDNGAQEIDVVINLGRLKDGDDPYVLRELRDVVEAADERPVKAILETCLLNREEKIRACQLVASSGAQFRLFMSDFQRQTRPKSKTLTDTLSGSYP